MKSVEMDFDGARWYAEAYSKAYDKLTGSIKNYMISTQSSLAPRTEQLKTQRLPCGDAGADLAGW